MAEIGRIPPAPPAVPAAGQTHGVQRSDWRQQGRRHPDDENHHPSEDQIELHEESSETSPDATPHPTAENGEIPTIDFKC